MLCLRDVSEGQHSREYIIYSFILFYSITSLNTPGSERLCDCYSHALLTLSICNVLKLALIINLQTDLSLTMLLYTIMPANAASIARHSLLILLIFLPLRVSVSLWTQDLSLRPIFRSFVCLHFSQFSCPLALVHGSHLIVTFTELIHPPLIYLC